MFLLLYYLYVELRSPRMIYFIVLYVLPDLKKHVFIVFGLDN